MTLKNRIALRRIAADLMRAADALLALAEMEDGLARATTRNATASKRTAGSTRIKKAAKAPAKKSAPKRKRRSKGKRKPATRGR